MKISLQWINEFFPSAKKGQSPLEQSSKLREKLPLFGLEIGETRLLGKGLDGVLVAEILSFEKHPQADRLNVCQVRWMEGKEPLQIVCGAPNVRKNMKVALATIGSVLPGDFAIKASKIRGVESFGMLCSERELGLSDADGGGILELPGDYKVGSKLVEAMNLNDEIWDVELTPDRADCLSHLGIAREIGRLLGMKVELPEFENLAASLKEVPLFSVEVQADKACPIYGAVLIEGVKKTDSPAWMKRSLEMLGHRSHNALVDITNYVVQELGHPLHAFDADKVAGSKLIVRFAKEGEKLLTLDNVERKLHPEDLIIADLEKPLALAGVMGGLESGVTEKTTRIVLESAVFDPVVIRRMAQRHKIHSEASHRFERGVDANNSLRAAGRACTLYSRITEARRRGAVCEIVSDEGRDLRQPSTLNFDLRAFQKCVGVDLDAEEVAKLLTSVGIDSQVKSPNVVRVEVPTHRIDLVREVDLIEETARLMGYDKIPERYPIQKTESVSKTFDLHTRLRRIRERMADTGLCQMMPYCFVSDAELSKLAGGSTHAVELENPLSGDWKYLRPNLFFGLSKILSNHVALGQHDVRIFDAGHVFSKMPLTENSLDSDAEKSPVTRAKAKRIPIKESYHLAWAMMGHSYASHWSTDKKSNDRKQLVDYFDAKGVFDKLMADLAAIEGRWASTQFVLLKSFLEKAEWLESLKSQAPWIPCDLLHPTRSAILVWPGKAPGAIVGYIGEIHPMYKADWLNFPRGLALGTAVAEIRFVDDLLQEMKDLREGKSLKDSSPYGKIALSKRVPIVERDISVVFGTDVSSLEIEKTLAKSVGPLLMKTECLDVYPLPEAKKSIAYRLYLQGDKTLSDAEIQDACKRALEGLQQKYGANQRS
jgi:phenylalanyl-tRNA synthetase beta chain